MKLAITIHVDDEVVGTHTAGELADLILDRDMPELSTDGVGFGVDFAIGDPQRPLTGRIEQCEFLTPRTWRLDADLQPGRHKPEDIEAVVLQFAVDAIDMSDHPDAPRKRAWALELPS